MASKVDAMLFSFRLSFLVLGSNILSMYYEGYASSRSYLIVILLRLHLVQVVHMRPFLDAKSVQIFRILRAFFHLVSLLP